MDMVQGSYNMTRVPIGVPHKPQKRTSVIYLLDAPPDWAHTCLPRRFFNWLHDDTRSAMGIPNEHVKF